MPNGNGFRLTAELFLIRRAAGRHGLARRLNRRRTWREWRRRLLRAPESGLPRTWRKPVARRRSRRKSPGCRGSSAVRSRTPSAIRPPDWRRGGNSFTACSIRWKRPQSLRTLNHSGGRGQSGQRHQERRTMRNRLSLRSSVDRSMPRITAARLLFQSFASSVARICRDSTSSRVEGS